MRGALVTLFVLLAVGGATLAAGWSVEAAGLPPAAHADRIAADAAAWFLRHRLASSSFKLQGRWEHGLCLRGWFTRPDGTRTHGTLLRTREGLRILGDGGPLKIGGVARPERPGLPLLQLELAGCPAILGPRIAAAAQTAAHLHVARAFAAGGPALALRLPPQHRDRLTLYVRPQTFRPLMVTASVGGVAGVARIRLLRLTPRQLRLLTAQAGKGLQAS